MKTVLGLAAWPLLLIGIFAAFIHMGLLAGCGLGIDLLSGKVDK